MVAQAILHREILHAHASLDLVLGILRTHLAILSPKILERVTGPSTFSFTPEPELIGPSHPYLRWRYDLKRTLPFHWFPLFFLTRTSCHTITPFFLNVVLRLQPHAFIAHSIRLHLVIFVPLTCHDFFLLVVFLDTSLPFRHGTA